MIIVATSGANGCLYCVVAHGALLRIYEKNPLIADQVAVNYRKADITPRQKAMLAFAMKVCTDSAAIVDADFAALREHGFSDEDAWDIGAITALLRPVQPHGQPDRDAAERRVLPDGAGAEGARRLEAAPDGRDAQPGGAVARRRRRLAPGRMGLDAAAAAGLDRGQPRHRRHQLRPCRHLRRLQRRIAVRRGAGAAAVAAQRMQLVSKCGIKLVTPARPDHQVKHYDTSAAHVRASVEHRCARCAPTASTCC